MKRTIALVLCLLMLLAMVVGCANNGDNPADGTTTPSASTTPGNNTDTPDTSSDQFVPDDIDPNTNLGGRTVTFLYWEDSENVEFFAEDQTGEGVNDAVYYRNLTIEDRLKVKLAFVPSPGKYEKQDEFVSRVNADITSNACEYDVVAAYSMVIATLAYKGMTHDLTQYDVLNFDKPWWPDNLLNESIIDGKLFFASGDISTNTLYMMYCCFFNNDMLDRYDLESPYELVAKNEWTLDKMIEMSQNIYEDDGNGTVDKADTFAFTLSSSVHLDPFYYGAGLKTMDKDADGLVTVSADITSEKAVNLVNKVKSYLNEGNYAFTNKDIFVEGRSLFRYDRVQIASKDLKDVEFFGIVPVPKYDSAQENYSTILGFPYSLYGISKGSRNEDDAAVTLECMASEGYRQVTPVVFEEGMKAKYAHDSTVAQMYDILRETLSFDIGRLFTMSFQKITFQKFREAVGEGSQDWSTMMKTQTKMLERLVGKFNDNFSGMEG